LISGDELALLRAEAASLSEGDRPQILRDRADAPPRIVYGPHVDSAAYATLSRLPRVIGPVQQLLGEQAYVYQSRLNLKLPFAADGWSWHQDFVSWYRNDGMPRPHAIMTAVFLHDCTAANGPLLVIPRSHSDSLDEILRREADIEGYKAQRITTETIDELAGRHGIVDLSGPAGSVALIHPTLLHGSAANMTPWARTICYINYNAVSNQVVHGKRPWYKNNPDTAPLVPVDRDDALLSPAHAA
jgi:ectoine hydroxylase